MCSLKFRKIHRKTPVSEISFNKVAGLGLQLYWKRTPRQVFSSEICVTFKNTFFTEHLQTAAFVICVISTAFIQTMKLKQLMKQLKSKVHSRDSAIPNVIIQDDRSLFADRYFDSLKKPSDTSCTFFALYRA